VVKSWGVINWYGDEFDIVTGPTNLREFCIDLRIDVIEAGREGETNYQIHVTTPLWLVSNFSEAVQLSTGYEDRVNEYIFGKGFLLLREYNVDLIKRFMESEINNLQYYAFEVS
jgi:hypothetical protein